jgi:dGTPase
MIGDAKEAGTGSMTWKTTRERIEFDETRHLHPRAARSGESRGREIPVEKCPVRTDYQRDRDRIIHCKAFRRLKGKTQVFFSSIGDHFRTRLTHTLEVSQIGRTVARALRLNEDLTEAIALGHDLGHTPFGHAGEEVLARLAPGGFHHARQSLRVVEVLENDGRGLNLCGETRDGILRHTKGTGPIEADEGSGVPETLEGEVVRFSDVIAYVNHDIDDAMRAGILKASDLPRGVFSVLGSTHSSRITSLVTAVLEATDLDRSGHISMESSRFEIMERLRTFLFETLYVHPDVTKELIKARTMLEFMWEYFTSDLDRFRRLFAQRIVEKPEVDLQDVTDFIAGMTDAYAIELYEELFIPRRWTIV